MLTHATSRTHTLSEKRKQLLATSKNSSQQCNSMLCIKSVLSPQCVTCLLEYAPKRQERCVQDTLTTNKNL